MIRRSQERLQRADADLALHCWVPDEVRGVLFYVHGLQSHAGWLFETGPALGELGIATYVLDRRGSGASSGERGDVQSSRDWIEDYLAAMDRVRVLHPASRLTLLGQSLGGSLAAGIACDPHATHDALVLCNPALDQRRSRLSAEQRAACLADRRASPAMPAPLREEDYTSDPRYASFIREDALTVRAFTPRFLAAALDLENAYMSAERQLGGKPSVLILSRRDRILDLEVSRHAFERLTDGRGIVVELPSIDHYLEFTPWRRALWHLLSAWVGSAGLGGLP